MRFWQTKGLLLAALVASLGPGMAAGVPRATDFSGRWTLVSATPARAGVDAFWLGTDARVTQTATTVTIDRLDPSPTRQAIFHVDGPGMESENVFTIDGVRQVKTSRVTLGTTLLISTETTTPDGRRWLTHINRWSLDSAGDLLVTDTVICGSGECPSIVTNLKFRKNPAPRT